MLKGRLSRYHWAFIIGPKKETPGSLGQRFHAKETMTTGGTSTWQYEHLRLSMKPIMMILVRIVVAKIRNEERLVSILGSTPMRPEQAGWNCVGWLKEAFESAVEDGGALGTAAKEWEEVREAAMGYVERKKGEHRFDGTVEVDGGRVPTWDMLEGRELWE